MSSVDIAKHDLRYVAIIILAGLLGGVLAQKIKVPDIVLFLLIGIGLGPAMAGLLEVPATSTMNQLILTMGACYLLFEGGATLRFAVLREIWITLLVMSTIGVLVTAVITAGFAAWIGIPVMTALVLGVVTCSTDPATLVPIFKQVPIKERVAQTVMSESACNDAMGAIATFAVVAYVTSGGTALNVGHMLQDLVWEAGGGILMGGLIGYGAAVLMAHTAMGIFRNDMPFLVVLAVIIAYLVADKCSASGFMAVFTCGVIIGNKEAFGLAMHHHEHEYLEDYMGNTSLLMRMFIFILLGSQVNFQLLEHYLWQGVALLAVFVLVARPLTVLLCAGSDRRAKWSWQELLFMSWTRETGVIPAALVGILAGMNVPGIDVVGAITFIFILGTILIQGPSTAWLARRLGLLRWQQPVPEQH